MSNQELGPIAVATARTVRAIKWALTACSFAAAVGLAVGTAAIKADNIRERRQLERTYRQVVALQATVEFESVAWKRATTVDALAASWKSLQERAAVSQGGGVRGDSSRQPSRLTTRARSATRAATVRGRE